MFDSYKKTKEIKNIKENYFFMFVVLLKISNKIKYN